MRAVAIVLLLSSLAQAGTCVQQVVAPVQHYAAAVTAPYTYQQQVLYFVGAPLRVESMLEQAKRTDGDYQEFMQFKAWKAGAASKLQAMTAPDSVTPPEPTPKSYVAQHCGKCHGTATPKGGYFLDGQSGIQPGSITAALRSIISGEMPKDHQLSREEKNQLLGELLSLEQPREGSDP